MPTNTKLLERVADVCAEIDDTFAMSEAGTLQPVAAKKKLRGLYREHSLAEAAARDNQKAPGKASPQVNRATGGNPLLINRSSCA